jgi:exopolyphosphatase/guanosine-5'-triphosphate,3'-diphosphate pyrophosphatase
VTATGGEPATGGERATGEEPPTGGEPAPTRPAATRWEWRTFGDRFGAVEAAFARLSPGAVTDSDELYLLSADGDTVKVRDDLMDVKRLREVDDDDLERWEPVLKASFPMDREEAATVFDALRIDRPATARERWTLDEFLSDVTGPGTPVREVRVGKRRVRYVIDGAQAELTDIVAADHPTRTIAIESEDPAAVVAAIEAVGLGDYLNTSYPRGLARLLDGTPARYAVVDCGTNSVKFQVAERGPEGDLRPIVDRAVVTRLGENLEERGELSSAAIERTAATVAEMVEQARALGVLAIAAVGTAGPRRARNRQEFLDAVHHRTRIRPHVISGDDEARLASLAAMVSLHAAAGSVVVFDTGGGSSQFTFAHGTEVDERFSLDVGAARFTEQFGLAEAVPAATIDELRTALGAELASLDGRPRPDTLIGMGGAVTNMAAVKLGLARYDPDVVHGTVLDTGEIDRQIDRYRSTDAVGRRSIVGLQSGRAEVILAGACIVRTVMDKLGRSELLVSDHGLRHGLMAERFG